MNQVLKTVKCGIVNLTRVKKRQLSREYDNLQNFLHGNERVELYSANKQQALRHYTKIKPDREYPLSIRKDLIDVQECNSDVCDYFVKIPVVSRWGGLKAPANSHIKIEELFGGLVENEGNWK